MDQFVLNAAFAAVMALLSLIMALIGWWAHMIWTLCKENSERISKLELRVAGEYVSNVELAMVVTDIRNAIVSAVTDMNDDMKYIRGKVDAITLHRREGDRS